MGIKLTFRDLNVSEEGFNIYRDTSSMSGLVLEDLPTPIATLGPGSTVYYDGDVTPGNTYYYLVGVFTSGGATELLSDEISILANEVSLSGFISSVFGNGENGAIYLSQPSYLGDNTLFKDASGLIPVSSDADPLKHWLSLTESLTEPTEELTNGTFDTDLTGWNDERGVVSTWNNSSVDLSYPGTEVGSFVQPLNLTPGQKYILTFELSNFVNLGGFACQTTNQYDGQGFQSVDYRSGSDGVHEVVFTATADDLYLNFNVGDGGESYTIDNVSIRAVRNKAIVSLTNSPDYREDSQLSWVQPDGASEFLELSEKIEYSEFTCIIAYYPGVQGNGRLIDNMDDGWGWQIRSAHSENKLALIVDDQGDGIMWTPGILTQGVDYIATLAYKPGLGVYRLNGVDQGEPEEIGGGISDMGDIRCGVYPRLFSANNGTEKFNGGFYGLIYIDRVLTESEMLQAESLLGKFSRAIT